jgi:hypothetical protein
MTSIAPPKTTRETFAMFESELGVVDAIVLAAYRHEKMLAAQKKMLNDKGVGISELMLILTLMALSQSTMDLKRDEVDAIFDAREKMHD